MKLLAAALIALLPLTANAADFARETAALQLVDYMNSKNPFDVELQEQIQVTMLQFAKTPCSEKTVPEIGQVLKSNLTYARIKPAIVKSYAENYSLQELTDIITFFRSKTGGLWLSKQRAQQASIQQYASTLMDEQTASIKAIMDKHVDATTGQCKAGSK